jgi:hypothetical protein
LIHQLYFQPTDNKPVIDLLADLKETKTIYTKTGRCPWSLSRSSLMALYRHGRPCTWKKIATHCIFPYYDVTAKGAFVMSLR